MRHEQEEQKDQLDPSKQQLHCLNDTAGALNASLLFLGKSQIICKLKCGFPVMFSLNGLFENGKFF